VATSTRVPLEVYLRNFEYEPDADYVDGEIEERPMGQDDHSAWQFAIPRWFAKHDIDWNIYIRPELRVRTSETRVRIPDVAILDASLPLKQVATHPPLAVFEVLSPEDRPSRMNRKLNDYAAMGIQQIWVIDPETKVFQLFEGGALVERNQFSLPAMNIEFEVCEITKLVR
jgi:Uma2 family endonuclease